MNTREGGAYLSGGKEERRKMRQMRERKESEGRDRFVYTSTVRRASVCLSDFPFRKRETEVQFIWKDPPSFAFCLDNRGGKRAANQSHSRTLVGSL